MVREILQGVESGAIISLCVFFLHIYVAMSVTVLPLQAYVSLNALKNAALGKKNTLGTWFWKKGTDLRVKSHSSQ